MNWVLLCNVSNRGSQHSLFILWMSNYFHRLEINMVWINRVAFMCVCICFNYMNRRQSNHLDRVRSGLAFIRLTFPPIGQQIYILFTQRTEIAAIRKLNKSVDFISKSINVVKKSVFSFSRSNTFVHFDFEPFKI